MTSLQKQLAELKTILLRANPPEHFSHREVIVAAITAFFIGLSFIFNTLLFNASKELTPLQLTSIILATIIILTLEIYFVGYARVHDKRRHFGQFWAKRFFSFYIVSILVSGILIYLYGLETLAGNSLVTLKVIIAASFPCAIGTALSDLLKFE